MKMNFAFKQMESSEALRSYAQSKLESKLNQFATKFIEANLTMAVKRHNHWVQCGIVAGDGFNFQVEAESHDMYASIDLLADKLERKLKRQKEVLKNHKRRDPSEPKTTKIDEADEWQNHSVDADDIVKYESTRRSRSA